MAVESSRSSSGRERPQDSTIRREGREIKPTVNAQTVLDIRYLASLHRSLAAKGYAVGTLSDTLRVAVEEYLRSLAACGKLALVGSYHEALVYLQSHGMAVAGRRGRSRVKSDIIEALARESAEAEAEQSSVAAIERSPAVGVKEKDDILDEFIESL